MPITGQIDAIADAVREAMVESLGLPERDRFQLITEHQPTRRLVLRRRLGQLSRNYRATRGDDATATHNDGPEPQHGSGSAGAEILGCLGTWRRTR